MPDTRFWREAHVGSVSVSALDVRGVYLGRALGGPFGAQRCAWGGWARSGRDLHLFGRGFPRSTGCRLFRTPAAAVR